jgi:hypothetical protein
VSEGIFRVLCPGHKLSQIKVVDPGKRLSWERERIFSWERGKILFSREKEKILSQERFFLFSQEREKILFSWEKKKIIFRERIFSRYYIIGTLCICVIKNFDRNLMKNMFQLF